MKQVSGVGVQGLLHDYVLRLKIWYKIEKNNFEICVPISSLSLFVKQNVSTRRPMLLSAKILKVLSVRVKHFCKRGSVGMGLPSSTLAIDSL